MGSFAYPITLIGPAGHITLEALVDTGATYTWIPRPLLEGLGVHSIGQEPLALADGRILHYDLGSLSARIDGKERTTICIFGDPGTEPLIGSYTLEGFLLGVDLVNQALIPVTGRLKGFRR